MKTTESYSPPVFNKGVKPFSIILLFAISAITISCNSQSPQNEQLLQPDAKDIVVTKYQNIDVAQFDILRKDMDYILMDVRTPNEIAAGKIGDALELDYFESSFDDDLKKLDKQRKYLVYCKVGGRSAKTAQKMVDMGFAHVYNLQGGYTSWFMANPENN